MDRFCVNRIGGGGKLSACAWGQRTRAGSEGVRQELKPATRIDGLLPVFSRLLCDVVPLKPRHAREPIRTDGAGQSLLANGPGRVAADVVGEAGDSAQTIAPLWCALHVGQPINRGPEQILLILTACTPVRAVELRSTLAQMSSERVEVGIFGASRRIEHTAEVQMQREHAGECDPDRGGQCPRPGVLRHLRRAAQQYQHKQGVHDRE